MSYRILPAPDEARFSTAKHLQKDPGMVREKAGFPVYLNLSWKDTGVAPVVN